MNIKTDKDLNKALEVAGLDWEVQSLPLRHPVSGEPTEYFATVRHDTGAILGAGFKSGYTPIQNRDSFSVISEIAKISENPIKLVNAMQFRGGAVLAAQIGLGSMFIGDPSDNDKIEKYVSFVNSHDGSKGQSFTLSPTRIVCMNTLNSVYASSVIKMKHTKKSLELVQKAPIMLQNILTQYMVTENVYNRLAKTKVTLGDAQDIIQKLFKADGESKRAKTLSENQISAVTNYFHDADGGRIEKNTAWNLYNAITRYNDHDRAVNVSSEIVNPGMREAAAKENRIYSVLLGNIAKENVTALDTIIGSYSLQEEINRLISSVESDTSMVDALISEVA